MTLSINTQAILDSDRIESGVGYSSDKTLAKYFDTSRSTIWLWTREGRLPSPVKLSNGSTRWANRDIKDFTSRAES